MEKYFSIYRDIDDVEIKIDDLDKEICDNLNLEYNHTNEIGIIDYGLFYFPEGKEDHDIFGGQLSISWVGFLNTVILHSNIRSGKVTKYELEASLAWCMNHSVDFPKSSAILMSQLTDFFIRKNYYLRVRGSSGKRFYKSGYVNPYYKSRIIENETGFFHIDDKGYLNNYYPIKNNIIQEPGNNLTNGIILNHLDIPVEVNDIGIIAGCNISVINRLTIPLNVIINEIVKGKECFTATYNKYQNRDLSSSLELLNNLSAGSPIPLEQIKMILHDKSLIKDFLINKWRIYIKDISFVK